MPGALYAENVDLVPGLTADDASGASATGRRLADSPRAQASLAGVSLVIVAVVLLAVGATLRVGAASLWSTSPLWSLFALAAALFGLLAFVPDVAGSDRRRQHSGWKAAAAGLIGLAGFWLLVALPHVASDRGFLLTCALACSAAAVWLAPSRRS